MEEPGTRTYTEEEYFELDKKAPKGVRLEYFDGYIYLAGKIFDPSMGWDAARNLAGATPRHNLIKHNVELCLGLLLRGRKCHVTSSDQQLELRGTGKYVYPDIVVACKPEYEGVMLANPDVVVEVISPSTTENDMDRKMEAYAALESIKEYWVVSQDEVRITQCYRTEAGWAFRRHSELRESIRCDALDLEISVREIYRDVFD